MSGTCRTRPSAAADAPLKWDGQPFTPKALTNAFAKIVRTAGVTPVGFHGLRHTHLSHLLADGVPVKVVSERAGHASAMMTLDVYRHLLSGMQEDTVRQVDASLRTMLDT